MLPPVSEERGRVRWRPLWQENRVDGSLQRYIEDFGEAYEQPVYLPGTGSACGCEPRTK